jgi:class 3 adenylate cyclase/tetratricopeptide (TPR) repeat protein
VADDLELPEGPVTVMFTDIEASTALRTTLGDVAADALFARHADLVREQIAAHRGHDLEAALGDGFLAVFASTRRAVSCAVAIQVALAAFDRGRAGPPLRVRIGLNTGEVAWSKGQPSGEAVHAASRVCAAAAGGEVFVSDVTRQLAGTMPDVTFTNRGEFELKGFPEPWRLWSLSWQVERREPTQEVFVRRDGELAQLRTRLDEALEGRGGLVLIGGEPGVGKTTLVRQLIKEAEGRGAIALFGRCYESEGTVPYSPFVETTEQALRVVPPEWVREDLGEDATEVARMVPELRRRFPDIGEPLDLPPEQQRRYFFNAISGFIGRASERLPIVLVVDDAHWADEPTLLLVEHVAERLPDLPVLAIGTYRDTELDVSRPLAATLERLLRAHLAHRIGLKRFDRDGVDEILRAHLGTEAPAGLVDAIFEETEGNAFFVDEVVRHLAEDGTLFDEQGNVRSTLEIGELEVPESVRLVVGRRIERLGPDAQRVLAAAAVVGRGFDFDLLERIAGIEVGRLLDIVDEAERARVIVPEERGSQVFYTFGHELIRQTLLASLSPPRRQRIHLAVADALEALDPAGADLRPSEIAAHLVQAGSAADLARTVTCLGRAARRAFEAAAFEEAVRMAESGLALLPATEDRSRLELLQLLGWAERALGHYDRCIELWGEVVDGYARADEPEAAAELCWELGYLQVWMNTLEGAVAAYHRGLEILGDRAVPARATLLGALGAISGLAGFLEPAEQQLGEAEALAAPLGDPREMGRIHWGRCLARFTNQRWPEALEDGEQAVELLRAAGDVWTLVDAKGWHAFPLLLSGRIAEARAHATEAVEAARRLGHRTGELFATRVVLMADTWDGANTPEEVMAGVRADVHLMEQMESPWVSQAYDWLSVLHTLQGDLEAGLAASERSAAAEPLSGFSGIGAGFRFLNRAYARDEPACRALLAGSRGLLPRHSDELRAGSGMLLNTVVEGCSLLGWADEVEELYPAMCGLAAQGVVRGYDLASAHRVAGMGAMALERWDEARAHLDRALEWRAGRPNRFDRPLLLHRCAELALRAPAVAGDLDARSLLAEAIAGYDAWPRPILRAMAADLARTIR